MISDYLPDSPTGYVMALLGALGLYYVMQMFGFF